ncbi:hypothetical protein [Legionella sp.]|uniref:hypothetical protein n=1 Tax=Legionella sp. TaxID=459 RepID=UPI003CA1DB8E
MSYEIRYCPNKIRKIFMVSPSLLGQKKRYISGDIETYAYYINNSSIVLDPSTDTENTNTQMLQTISEGINELKDLSEEKKYNKILIPVAEEQKIFGLFKRNHWVTLEYNLNTNQATLLDSRPWFISLFYPTSAMEHELKKGITSIYGSVIASNMSFKKEYQGVQLNDVYCGAWTTRNILDLSGSSENGPTSMDEQKNKYKSNNEAEVVNANLKLLNKSANNIDDASQNSTHNTIEHHNISLSMINISMLVLSGFMAVVGCAAVATAFVLLNAATFGVPGVIVAGLGIASALTGVGLFAIDTYKNRQKHSELDNSTDFTAVS